MRYLLLLLLAACRLPHIDPEPRPGRAQYATDVEIVTICGHGDAWSGANSAKGVIISERHVLTAAHAVRCAELPRAYVRLRDGREFRMVVERDDQMFPHAREGTDVARLEIASAERFGLGIAPPQLGELRGGLPVCAPSGCSRLDPYHPNQVDLPSEQGDSGSAVYDIRGRLVGLVVRSNGVSTILEPVTAYWLEGT